MADSRVSGVARGANMRRRALIGGAVVGLAGTVVAAQTLPSEASVEEPIPLDWFNVKDHGAKGDGSTDDTAAVQEAITAASKAGGTVYFPAGKYKVVPTADSPALSVTSDGVRLVGAGAQASTLVKGANGILLRISGAPTDSKGVEHVHYCAVENLGFNGNAKTGLLLELYYNSASYFRDIYMSSNRDVCIDAVELWDSRFYNLVIESSTGTAGSTTQPCVWLRNSSSATDGAWGYSEDNVNQVHFIGCRIENFGTGALWVTQGTAKMNNPNGIYLTDCKFETSAMQGGPHLKVDASCRHVHASNIYCFAGGFADGYTTAQNIIAWAGVDSSLENVLIANNLASATVNSGIDLYSGAGSTAVLRNVMGRYQTKPTGSHIYYEASSTGDFRVENSHSNIGGQSGGTVPTTNQQNAPLRLVAGKVSDASFTQIPVDGTLAVDATNKRLYVRVAGSWLSTALS